MIKNGSLQHNFFSPVLPTRMYFKTRENEQISTENNKSAQGCVFEGRGHR